MSGIHKLINTSMSERNRVSFVTLRGVMIYNNDNHCLQLTLGADIAETVEAFNYIFKLEEHALSASERKGKVIIKSLHWARDTDEFTIEAPCSFTYYESDVHQPSYVLPQSDTTGVV